MLRTCLVSLHNVKGNSILVVCTDAVVEYCVALEMLAASVLQSSS